MSGGLDFGPIPMPPNTLHISTLMIDERGKYHWSLYITDAKGTIARYHWSANLAAGPHNNLPAEQFTFNTVKGPVTKMSKTMQMFFAMVRINAYAPRADTTHDVLVGLFKTVFERSYQRVEDNRDADITCRTWIFAVLQKLREVGLLRLSKEEVASLEERVQSITKNAEDLTNNGHPTTTVISI